MNEYFWYLSRGTGVVAFLALTATLALGILARSGRDLAGWGRFGVSELHRSTAGVATALVVTHVVALLLDTESGITVLHAIVPFTSSFEPFGVGLGVLATEVLTVLAVTGVLRHRIGPKAFHVVHWSAYAMWPLAAGHFLLSGTDAGTWWAITTLVIAGAVLTAAVTWRLSAGFIASGRPTRTVDGVLPRRHQEVGR